MQRGDQGGLLAADGVEPAEEPVGGVRRSEDVEVVLAVVDRAGLAADLLAGVQERRGAALAGEREDVAVWLVHEDEAVDAVADLAGEVEEA